jgi:hypothetical protein
LTNSNDNHLNKKPKLKGKLIYQLHSNMIPSYINDKIGIFQLNKEKDDCLLWNISKNKPLHEKKYKKENLIQFLQTKQKEESL